MAKFLLAVIFIFLAAKLFFFGLAVVIEAIGGGNTFLLIAAIVAGYVYWVATAKPKEPSFSEDCKACVSTKRANEPAKPNPRSDGELLQDARCPECLGLRLP